MTKGARALSAMVSTWINLNDSRVSEGVNKLTHSGLATPKGDTELSQHWLR